MRLPHLFLIVLLATPAFAIKPKTVTPEQAVHYVGDMGVGVRGKVSQVMERHGDVYLNFGGEYPNQAFTIFIPKANVKDVFPKGDFAKLKGKILETGAPERLSKGKPETIVSRPDEFWLAK